MIELKHLFKSYGQGRNILADINFKIAAKEFVCVTGPSGAGKSTLLKMIAAIEPPSRGAVHINNQRIDKLPKLALPYLKRSIGVILQNTQLLFDRSAIDNVILPLAINGIDKKTSYKRARAAMEKVGLGDHYELSPVEMSGGEQQRLAIARAIVNRPKILIADEPTANLDANTALRIMDVFKDFNQVGVTTIIASHDTNLMAKYTSRNLHIENARLIDSKDIG